MSDPEKNANLVESGDMDVEKIGDNDEHEVSKESLEGGFDLRQVLVRCSLKYLFN